MPGFFFFVACTETKHIDKSLVKAYFVFVNYYMSYLSEVTMVWKIQLLPFAKKLIKEN